jgi:hypothetical protein
LGVTLKRVADSFDPTIIASDDSVGGAFNPDCAIEPIGLRELAEC